MVRIALVILLTLVLLSFAGSAFAYRLIVVPTADVLPQGVYKYEFSGPFIDNAQDGSPISHKWLFSHRFDMTVWKNLEIGLKFSCPPNSGRPYFDAVNGKGGVLSNVQLQLAPETKTAPGYGVGAWNVLNSAGYATVKPSFFAGVFKTFNVGLRYPIKVHLLGGTEQLQGVFGGVILPLSKRFSAAAEIMPQGTDTDNLRLPGQNSNSSFVFALGYNQSKNLRFKWATLQGNSAWGIVYTNQVTLYW